MHERSPELENWKRIRTFHALCFKYLHNRMIKTSLSIKTAVNKFRFRNYAINDATLLLTVCIFSVRL